MYLFLYSRGGSRGGDDINDLVDYYSNFKTQGLKLFFLFFFFIFLINLRPIDISFYTIDFNFVLTYIQSLV